MKVRAKFSGCIRLRFVPALLIWGVLLMLPAAQGAAPVATKSIVVLGDSLAAGLGVDPSESFPSLIQNKIDSAGWNYRVVNAGVSGDTSADGLAASIGSLNKGSTCWSWNSVETMVCAAFRWRPPKPI